MALDPSVEELIRRKIGEENPASTWTSDEIEEYYAGEGNGNADLTAGLIWRAKAGRFSALVNLSESGSSRNNGDLYKNALAMSDIYIKAAGGTVTPVVSVAQRAKTFPIAR